MLDAANCPSKYDLDFLQVDLSTSVYPDHARFGYRFNTQILSELRRAENNPLPLILHLGMALCALEVADSLQHDEVSVYYDDETDFRSVPPQCADDSRIRPILEICNETAIEFGASNQQSRSDTENLIQIVVGDLEGDLEYKAPYELREKVAGQDVFVQSISEPALTLGRHGYGFHRNASELRDAIQTFSELPLVVVISYVESERKQVYLTQQFEQFERDLNLIFVITPTQASPKYKVELHLVSQTSLPDLRRCQVDDLDNDDDKRLAVWQQRVAKIFEACRE